MCDRCVLKAAHVLTAALAGIEHVTPLGHDAEDAEYARRMCQDMSTMIDALKPGIPEGSIPVQASALVDQMITMGADRLGSMVRLNGMWLHLLEESNRLAVATLTALAEHGDVAAIAWMLLHGHELIHRSDDGTTDTPAPAGTIVVSLGGAPKSPFGRPPRPQDLN